MGSSDADDINRLLCGLTAFEMRNSAEGAFDLHDLRDAITLTVALTAGLIAGAVLSSTKWHRSAEGCPIVVDELASGGLQAGSP